MKLDAMKGLGTDYSGYIGVVFLIIALVFVWRSFYKMRIPLKE
jgi:K(+)-stimulated pyrophosphate-energized sodium pump